MKLYRSNVDELLRFQIICDDVKDFSPNDGMNMNGTAQQ